ncbi:MAG: DUF4199 domain-containing protein [Patescibacteria group bacterium]
MKKPTYNATVYGLLLTVVPVICLVLMEITGNNLTFDNPTWYDIAIQTVLPVFILYLGIRARKKQLGGLITWKQGTVAGFEISLIFALISPFVFLAYYYFVNFKIIASVRNAYHLTRASDMGVIRIDMLLQFVSALIFGLIVSSIISFFIRSKTLNPEIK